ncbi:MAG: DUF4386 domain-containing protein [Candidatus Acidiferrales bacterium]
MMKRIAEASPSFQARVAGVLYFFNVLTAIFGEVVRGRLGYPAGDIAIVAMAAMTLILYGIFKPVNWGLALLAVACNLVGLSFEALRLIPHGVDVALVFTGCFCIVTGYLIFTSTFLPRILGALMAFAGLGWLTYMSPPLAKRLSPDNLPAGLLGEVAVFLWLVVKGVSVHQHAGAAQERQ